MLKFCLMCAAVGMMFSFRLEASSFLLAENRLRKSAKMEPVSFRKHNSEIADVDSFVYAFFMLVAWLVECGLAAWLVGDWLLFTNWWTVSLMLFPMVFAIVYVRHHVSRLTMNSDNSKAWLESDARLKRVHDCGIAIADDVFGGDKGKCDGYAKYAEGERATEREATCLSVHDEVPEWIDIGVSRVAVLCHLSIALIDVCILFEPVFKKGGF